MNFNEVIGRIHELLMNEYIAGIATILIIACALTLAMGLAEKAKFWLISILVAITLIYGSANIANFIWG